jgi:large subunit ribosomal protein L10
MLTKTQKQQLIEELADKLKRQKGLVFTDFRGLKVGEIENLRKELKEAEIEYKVAKKTLIKLALEKAKKKIDISQFKDSVALAFGFQDSIMPAKIINNFSKKYKNLKILGGLVDDKFLTIDEVKELAKIPSRDELLAKFVGSLKSPIKGFVNVLEGNIFTFINLLKQVSNE